MDFRMLKVQNKKVLFVWVDECEGLEFERNGLIIQRKPDAQRMRWGKVVAIGDKVTDVAIDEYILPEATQEPFGAKLRQGEEEIEVWACQENDIMCTTDDVAETYNLNDEGSAQQLKRAV